MGGCGWPPLILWIAAILLLPDYAGSSSHSMQNFYTAVSEPGQGLPQFVAVGYMDDQPIAHYDSDTQKKVPVVPWMKKVEKDDAEYWERNTQRLHRWEQTFRIDLETLKDRYNQSKGFHTLQYMVGCELSQDGGYWQYGYDGRDHLSFDKETLTWTAANTQAQVTKMKWDPDLADNQYVKAYLEEICIEWLRRYLDYGKEVLLRTEPPVGKVTRQVVQDGQESLICQAYGFYPKEIDTTWRKDGEIMEHATFRRDVSPSSDGTYHAWLSIDIDPKERNRYQCHMDHASLSKTLVLAWEEPANMWVIVGAVLTVLAVLGVTAGIICYFIKKRQEKAEYRKTSTNDQGSDSSAIALRVGA